MPFLFVIGLLFSSSLYGQTPLPYHKDSIKDFTFVAISGRVDAQLKQRLIPAENFIILKGDVATLQIVNLMNDEMGRNGIGGITHTGPIKSLEITDETKYIEIYFILGAASMMISIRIKYWDDGEAIVYVEPLNTGKAVTLEGYLYKSDEVKTIEGANK